MESRIDKLHFEYSKNSKPQIKNVSQIQILQNKAMRKKLDRLDKKGTYYLRVPNWDPLQFTKIGHLILRTFLGLKFLERWKLLKVWIIIRS